MTKMGWRGQGYGVGKNDDGIAEPVNVHTQENRLGLGFEQAFCSGAPRAQRPSLDDASWGKREEVGIAPKSGGWGQPVQPRKRRRAEATSRPAPQRASASGGWGNSIPTGLQQMHPDRVAALERQRGDGPQRTDDTHSWGRNVRGADELRRQATGQGDAVRSDGWGRSSSQRSSWNNPRSERVWQEHPKQGGWGR